MARTSQELTQSEINFFNQFCAENGIVLDGDIGIQNGNHLGNYIVETLNTDITPQTLAAALEKQRDRIVFYTPLEIEHRKLASRMSEPERELIFSFISRRGLQNEGDALLTNFNTIAAYFAEKNLPIATNTIDSALTNITSNGRRSLLWKKRLQDSEAAASRQKEEAAKQPARNERTELVGENTLAPHLREHRRQMHAALAEAGANKPEVQSANADVMWKQRAEDAVASISSHLDRAEATKFLSRGAAWGYELVFKQVQTFIERRKHQRQMVGR
jgi:hypothetical protein